MTPPLGGRAAGRAAGGAEEENFGTGAEEENFGTGPEEENPVINTTGNSDWESNAGNSNVETPPAGQFEGDASAMRMAVDGESTILATPGSQMTEADQNSLRGYQMPEVDWNGSPVSDVDSQMTEADQNVPAQPPAAPAQPAAAPAQPLQRAQWPEEPTAKSWPPQPIESPEGGPDDMDRAVIMDAITEAEKSMTGNTKPVLLHLGIGVGDPGETLTDVNNPTTDIAAGLRGAQVNPPFLADAANNGFHVVALNFNQPDGDYPITNTGLNGGVHLQVPARFPLGGANTAAARDVFPALQELAQKANRVVVLNAVSQSNYRGMVDLVPRPQPLSMSYVHAYGLSPIQVVNPMHRGFAFTHGTFPGTLGDLFQDIGTT